MALEEPLPEELPPRRAAEAEAEAACQEAPAASAADTVQRF